MEIDVQGIRKARESIMKVFMSIKRYALCGANSYSFLLLLQYVCDHKSRFKWLAGVHFVADIPKTQSGKILRRVLREQAKAMIETGVILVFLSAKL